MVRIYIYILIWTIEAVMLSRPNRYFSHICWKREWGNVCLFDEIAFSTLFLSIGFMTPSVTVLSYQNGPLLWTLLLALLKSFLQWTRIQELLRNNLLFAMFRNLAFNPNQGYCFFWCYRFVRWFRPCASDNITNSLHVRRNESCCNVNALIYSKLGVRFTRETSSYLLS